MELEVSAPNRIDLAGGTTDLHPLYLFLDGGCTVNIGITVNSRVRIRIREEGDISIRSEDLGESQWAADADGLNTAGPLGLVARTLSALPPVGGLEVITRNDAPAGSGLGASSALVTALVAGLLKLRGEDRTPSEMIRLATDIETAAIQVPAGSQDHIAAVYGGVSLLTFGYEGFKRKNVVLDSNWKKALESTIILSYTEEGRFSGVNNWEIIKSFIDRKDSVREKLLEIRDVAREMSDVLLTGGMHKISPLVNQEWSLRRSLATGVTNAHIDAIISSTVRAGALANKICGAGGGGCMVTIVEPDTRARVEEAIRVQGGRIIPFRINTEGLRIRT